MHMTSRHPKHGIMKVWSSPSSTSGRKGWGIIVVPHFLKSVKFMVVCSLNKLYGQNLLYGACSAKDQDLVWTGKSYWFKLCKQCMSLREHVHTFSLLTDTNMYGTTCMSTCTMASRTLTVPVETSSQAISVSKHSHYKAGWTCRMKHTKRLRKQHFMCDVTYPN